MTLQELYQNIEGDYDRAIRVLRIEKLMDKHIRKLTTNGTVDALLAAGETMDPVSLFETSHAVKGVCGNLGLVKLSELASDISENYRPGNEPFMNDDEVKAKLKEIEELYNRTVEEIRKYEEG